jgi:hypothetical protein
MAKKLNRKEKASIDISSILCQFIKKGIVRVKFLTDRPPYKFIHLFRIIKRHFNELTFSTMRSKNFISRSFKTSIYINNNVMLIVKLTTLLTRPTYVCKT